MEGRNGGIDLEHIGRQAEGIFGGQFLQGLLFSQLIPIENPQIFVGVKLEQNMFYVTEGEWARNFPLELFVKITFPFP